MNTPTTTLPKQSEHLSIALRALAVNAPDADTQNHLHALATDAYELANSHQALVEALGGLITWAEEYSQGGKCPTFDAIYEARAALRSAQS